MDDSTRSSTNPPRRFQFSIRTLLEVTAVVACLCAAWAWRYHQQRRAIEGSRLNATLALNDLVAKLAGNARVLAQGGSHGQGEDTDYWLIRLTSKTSGSQKSETLPENLNAMVARRLSELGADVKQSALAGWGDSGNGHPFPSAAGRQIMYRFGDLRGVIVMRAVFVPDPEPAVGLTVENIQFR